MKKRYGVYPADDVLVALMEETGHYRALTKRLGMTVEGLRRYLRKHPDLKARLDDARWFQYPSADELIALMRQHGSYSGVARAIGIARGALENHVQRAGLRVQLDDVRRESERVWPSDDALCAAMARLRSIKHVALEFGMPYRSFWVHLYRHPDLKARLDEHSALMRTPEAQRDRRRAWERRYHAERPWLGKARRPARRKRILRGDPCAYCGGPGGTVDHIEPVIHGGTDDWLNLTSACFRCNRAKSDTPLLLFMLGSVT